MKRSEIDPAALLGAVLAAGLVLMIEKGPFGWLSTVGGLMLLMVIFAYDQEGHRSVFQSIAFSGVAGFCLVLATAIVPEILLGGIHRDDSVVSAWMLGSTWVVATVLLTLLDRWKLKRRAIRDAK
jgi:hypothetical protein